jgi:hypothetical protein
LDALKNRRDTGGATFLTATIKVNVNGTEYDAREEEFQVINEDWSNYSLISGGRVRVMTTVQKIYQVLDADGQPLRTPDGEPVMFVKHNSQVVASR